MKGGFIRETTKSSEIDTVRQEIRLACLRIGEAMYGIDILRIREIIRPLKLTPIPKAPAFVEGVINLRGVVIPIVDLRKRFDQPEIVNGRLTRIIICTIEGKSVGLIVDEVAEVRRYIRQEVQPAPQFIKSGSAEFFLGVCRRNDDLLMVLNLEKILTTTERIDIDRLQ